MVYSLPRLLRIYFIPNSEFAHTDSVSTDPCVCGRMDCIVWFVLFVNLPLSLPCEMPGGLFFFPELPDTNGLITGNSLSGPLGCSVQYTVCSKEEI